MTDDEEATQAMLRMRAEIERLSAENKQLGDHWNDISYERNDLRAEVERICSENLALKQALGYPIPADKETINNPWKCGCCDARGAEVERLRLQSAALLAAMHQLVYLDSLTNTWRTRWHGETDVSNFAATAIKLAEGK